MSIRIGICYGFEVMRISESPNIPFTCIFERFKKGNDNLITASCDTCGFMQLQQPLFTTIAVIFISTASTESHCSFRSHGLS